MLNAMAFIQPKVTLSITITGKQQDGDRYQAAIKKLLESCSLEEVELLAKAAAQPAIKAVAVQQLKQIL